jgi:hypothetical protein
MRRYYIGQEVKIFYKEKWIDAVVVRYPPGFNDDAVEVMYEDHEGYKRRYTRRITTHGHLIRSNECDFLR